MTLSEPERRAGLTDPLSPGETILWQVSPQTDRMAASIFHYRWLALYVAGAMVLGLIGARQSGYPFGQGVAMVMLAIPFAAIGFALLELLGRLTAKAATYTLTNRRLILKIGVALDMTISVPLSAVTNAAVRKGKGATGDIALTVKDGGGVGYLALWPHARPWHVSIPQPMLRALPDVEAAAMIIGDALASFNAGGRVRDAALAAPQPTAPRAITLKEAVSA
jgi:hypothetical protein